MAMQSELHFGGQVQIKVIRPKKAPLGWRIRNALRPKFILGWLVAFVLFPFLKLTRLPVMVAMGELRIKVRDGLTGEWTDYGTVSRQVITTAGVTYLRDDWNGGANDFSNMNYHGIGTGNTAEAAGDTALVTESTTALNPNSTRATGTKSVPAATQWQTVGTLTCDADIAVVEHGIFSQAATGGGTLWDRSVFAAINLVGANPDSIQCTYVCTMSAGG